MAMISLSRVIVTVTLQRVFPTHFEKKGGGGRDSPPSSGGPHRPRSAPASLLPPQQETSRRSCIECCGRAVPPRSSRRGVPHPLARVVVPICFHPTIPPGSRRKGGGRIPLPRVVVIRFSVASPPPGGFRSRPRLGGRVSISFRRTFSPRSSRGCPHGGPDRPKKRFLWRYFNVFPLTIMHRARVGEQAHIYEDRPVFAYGRLSRRSACTSTCRPSGVCVPGGNRCVVIRSR